MIRYQMRACSDRKKINSFLATARVGYLGLVDKDIAYVVPLNFVWYHNNIYFHGATEGRKSELLKRNTKASFTVCEEYGTLTDPVPARTDTAYLSVMLFGKAEQVTDLETATDVMQHMLDKYVPGYYDRPLSSNHVKKYRSSLGSTAAIICIHPDQLTAKENLLDEKKKFVP